MPFNERATANTHIMDTWIPRISARWSAATDDKCPHAPTSDDYHMWTHVQLKRELAQRNLRIDPKNRNKRAYAELLLTSDAAASAASMQSVHDPTASTEPATCEIESIDIQTVAASQGSPSFQVTSSVRASQELASVPITRPPRVVSASSSVHESSPSAEPTPARAAKTLSQHPQAIAIIADDDNDDPTQVIAFEDAARCTTLQQRKRAAPSSDHVADLDANKTQQHEYLRHALSLKAAKVDLQTRRLEMDTKRDEHSHELQQVQLALAQEQLKQAKLGTQKLSTEWIVEQALHKKRLRDAGFSEHDIAAIM